MKIKRFDRVYLDGFVRVKFWIFYFFLVYDEPGGVGRVCVVMDDKIGLAGGDI